MKVHTHYEVQTNKLTEKLSRGAWNLAQKLFTIRELDTVFDPEIVTRITTDVRYTRDIFNTLYSRTAEPYDSTESETESSAFVEPTVEYRVLTSPRLDGLILVATVKDLQVPWQTHYRTKEDQHWVISTFCTGTNEEMLTYGNTQYYVHLFYQMFSHILIAEWTTKAQRKKAQIEEFQANLHDHVAYIEDDGYVTTPF